ncbi:MAG: alginate lyase [Daejeonella sp.]|nr:alginate lyase [Daejeonella sp.]
MKKLFSILFLIAFCLFQMPSFAQKNNTRKADFNTKKRVENILKQQVLREAEWALKQQPITVTAERSPRSAGGKHDFFSEADYFWPDPKNPDGPYVNRDGMSNPDNFVAHRKAMIRFGTIIGALASAYKITGDEKYVKHALIHLQAWFIDGETLMTPNLLYAQAIKGLFTGRSWGIIDSIHLMEVAQGALVMESSGAFDKNIAAGVKSWFSKYLDWLNTHSNSLTEKVAKNNHSTCWTMQVASFAKLCKNEAILDSCRARYKNILLPNQMAIDGSFPLEMARTKPYGYTIFNLDAMAAICQILSTPQDNLWKYETPDGKSISKGISYLYPFIVNKSSWKLKPDVMYWNEWPVAQPFLIFGANAFQQQNWFSAWKNMEHNLKVEEVIRNVPIRHPLIWL